MNPAKLRKSPGFEAFANEYLEWVSTNRKPLTYRASLTRLKSLRVMFGTKKLSDITAWHMEQYKKTRKDAGRAPATINGELTLLKSMLNKAVSWNKLTGHPGREVKLLKVVNEKTRFLSEEED